MFVKSITLGIIVLVFFGLVNTVDAQSYDLHLVLNPLESSISEGDVLGFSGILTTSDQQYVITDAAIVIKDDVDFGSDRVIATGYTDENGEFFISWVAKTRQSGGSYDFYAVFEESDLKTRSVTHNVSVTSATQNYVSILTLDPISSLVQQGNKIVFSGILKTTTGEVVTGFPIFIKDDREGISDIVLKTTVTDSNGKFSTTWDAVPRNSGSYDIYAEFKGGENISKSRSDTFSVKVSGTPSASGKLSTKLLLNNIPSSIYTGNVITFTGKLTSDGIPLSGKLIQIKEDDPFLVDQRLGYGRTNSNGEFFIDWNITPGLVETDFDVHATFDGDDLYNIARTANQEMSVVRLWSSITLDSIPQNVDVGGQVTFSGNVQLEKGSPEGYVVYVMDEDAFDDDDLLATAYVNSDGSYSIIWSAEQVDADNIADIYVVFEGTSIYYRSTTCDDDNTFDFGGDCLNTIKLKTIGVTLEPDPVYQPPTSGYKFNGDEYMELYYALSFNKNPVIAIIPQPDSYDEVKPYFIPIQEGIRTWNLGLEKTGGDWNVDFDIIKPGEKFPQRPDVIINVVAYDDDIDCGYTRGVAWISGEKPLNSKVCATSFGKPANPDSVSATSGHEFIHTIGLGHAFNKKGDVMCSVENGKSTCPSLFGGKSKFPNDFNFEAVKVMYGKDGWKNPNYSVTYGEKFTVNDFNSEQPIVTTNPINEPDDYEENLVDHLSVYFTSPNSIEFYGSTVSCQDNFGDSVYVKIFNPYGKNIISKNISLTNSCWFESKVSLNFDDVIEGEWKIIAKYFDSTNESNFTIYSWETPVTPTPVTPTHFTKYVDPQKRFIVNIPNNWDQEYSSSWVTFYDDIDNWNALLMIEHVEDSYLQTENLYDVLDELRYLEKTYCELYTFAQEGQICNNFKELSSDVNENNVAILWSHTDQYGDSNSEKFEMISFSYWFFDGDDHWSIFGSVDQSYEDIYLKKIDESVISFKISDKKNPSFNNPESIITPSLSITQTEVHSNKEHYTINDKIILNGQTPSKITPVKIRIDDQDGNLIKLLQIPDNGRTEFSTSIKIEKMWFTKSGEYTIYAWTSSAEPDKDSLKITITIPGSEQVKKEKVPTWVKNNAKWWADGQIDDDAFTQGIQFLIKEKIVDVESISQSSTEAKEIPTWVKNNAKWWADGSIDEGSFVTGIEFLIKEGIISVN